MGGKQYRHMEVKCNALNSINSNEAISKTEMALQSDLIRTPYNWYLLAVMVTMFLFHGEF